MISKHVFAVATEAARKNFDSKILLNKNSIDSEEELKEIQRITKVGSWHLAIIFECLKKGTSSLYTKSCCSFC